jgi:uncharacterized RDD family membrane protein YckC/DNA-directed RNA polymerase subunit RPC12/RpoP
MTWVRIITFLHLEKRPLFWKVARYPQERSAKTNSGGEAMQVICPTCNTKYNIQGERIPQAKKAAATCKKCGGRIVIEPSADQEHVCISQAESVSRSTTPAPAVQSHCINEETGEFTFITDNGRFRGYAGFWKRFAAAIIDGFSLMIGGFILGGIIGLVYGLSAGTSQGADILSNIVGIAMGWLYFAIMESSSKQGTLGKMALGIKVTDLSGNAISFGKATGRHFSKFISMVTLSIGYLLAGFTSKKQGLHDMMAGCLVVNAR